MEFKDKLKICDEDFKHNKGEWNEIQVNMKAEMKKLADQLENAQLEINILQKENECIKKDKLYANTKSIGMQGDAIKNQEKLMSYVKKKIVSKNDYVVIKGYADEMGIKLK